MSIIWSPTGLSLSSKELEMLRHPYTAGIIFFAYNYQSPQQIKQMIDEALTTNPDLIISVDQEGGRVQRFIQGLTTLPAMQNLGTLYLKDKQQGIDAAYIIGRLCGEELQQLGVNVNYAPVLDLNYGINQMIGTRSFGGDSDLIIDLATSYLKGLAAAAVIGVGKHFPGHGGVKEDSHHTMPNDDRDAESFKQDSRVFASLAPHLELMMTSHIVFSQMDEKPVTFSPFWLQDKLRNEMNYQGLIISDDLSMGAVKQVYQAIGEAVIAAVKTGCDIALVCNDVDAAEQTLDKLQRQAEVDVAVAKVNEATKQKIKQLLVKYKRANDDFDIDQAQNLARQLRGII